MKLVHYVVNILQFLGLSSLPEHDQYPLSLEDIHDIHTDNGPIPPFVPPGVDPDNRIKCHYDMGEQWVHPDSPNERKVWLRNTVTKDEYNISTNYETTWPKGQLRKHEIVVNNDTKANWDGVDFHGAKMFNNTFPGPWIQITVKNELHYNGTAIHWHGLRQLNHSLMDGVPGVTQCPIAPEKTFTYRFNATQYGTSWYHSHYTLQYTDGLLGPLTIHGPTSDNWDFSRDPILLGDHIHASAFERYYQEQFGGRKGSGVASPPKMQSILVNGRGSFAGIVPSRYNTTVKGDKRYLLRLINTSTDTTYIFTIDNHNFTVVEADLVPVKPYITDHLAIGIGQRYHVVLNTWPEPQRNNTNEFWIRTIPATHCSSFDASNGTFLEVRQGILYYENHTKTWPETTELPKVNYDCRDEPFGRLEPVVPWTVPKLSTDEKGQYSTPNASVRLGEWLLPEEPHASAGPEVNNWNIMDDPIWVRYGKPTVNNLEPPYPNNSVVYEVSADASHHNWNYMVIIGNQKTNPGSSKGGRLVPAAHPIHLHGHDFALLQQSSEPYVNETSLNPKYTNPPRRDVVLLPRNGFIVIAFRTDNPGAWAVHCHIGWHASAGLAFQILETKDAFKKLMESQPQDVAQLEKGCSEWDEWYKNPNNYWKPFGRFQDDSGI
ncbi:multicopper oxidase [Aspergillus aurantiobrunneus]